MSARRIALATAAASLALGATLAGPGVAAGPQERIVGGNVADPADWPFAGALQIKDRTFGYVLDCGASVISPRFAITAAHCAIGVNPRRFLLVVGRPNLARKAAGQEIRIRRSRVNPAYGPPNFRNDVAILELRHRTSVTPVDLPTIPQSDAATMPGSPLEVAGWGGTRSNGSEPSRRLRTTTETALKPARCKRTYGRSFSNDTTICAQAAKLDGSAHRHAGACYGDSGGPLVADGPDGPLLLGAVSGGGLRCGTSPDYYGRISASLRFIRRVTGVTPP